MVHIREYESSPLKEVKKQEQDLDPVFRPSELVRLHVLPSLIFIFISDNYGHLEQILSFISTTNFDG